MKEILYIEVPIIETQVVIDWLQNSWQIPRGTKKITNKGVILEQDIQLSIFIWSLQRTTYLKVFRYGQQACRDENNIVESLFEQIRAQFPSNYPQPPLIDLEKDNIFDKLEPYYPKTVHFFKKMPKGQFDLQRLYWWEKTWREQLENPSQPKQVIFKQENSSSTNIEYDLVYIGGALGALHAAMMAKLGHKVLLIERLPFGRMNREWNISRAEFQTLIDLELFTQEQFESIIAREYIDGFSKFFDGYIPKSIKAATLHTPTVLNIAINSDRLLALCGQKLKENGATIWDQTEFKQAEIDDKGVSVNVLDLKTGDNKQARARLLIDAMGTASPIAWQLNGSRTFDSVCPTVGAIVEGIDPSVWDARYGDVLNSHGDISRGRQLIWELFPGPGQEMTIYLFHYHQVHRDNPGSLLEMYEDFFHILPEYRRCDMDQLVWKKPTFGYIPGYFSKGKSDRKIAYDRILAIGDAASLQSPLIFTGFGSLVRNLGRLTTLLDIALKNDLLTQGDLAQISAYQSNVAVTWLFSKGMMVPTGRILPPERVNAMLNTFFGLLASEPPEVADTFIKDRTDWFTFTRLALKAARQNPSLLLWIWDMAGLWEMMRWLITFVDFTLEEISFKFLSFWFPQWLSAQSSWLEGKFPRFWLKAQALQSRIQL